MKNLRVTPVPPASPKDWYGRTTPCRHCKAWVLYRNDVGGDLVTITVRHRKGCPALEE